MQQTENLREMTFSPHTKHKCTLYIWYNGSGTAGTNVVVQLVPW